MKITTLLVFALCISMSVWGQNFSTYYNVKNYGARADGRTIDSPAINKAIDEAAKAGGGTVFFPAGNYLSLSIRLKSNICLHFDQGAVLTAATPSDSVGWYDFPEPNIWVDSLRYQDFGHSHWHNSLIWGENLENVSITGFGLIHGKGILRGGGDKRKLSGLEATTQKIVDMKGQANKAIALKNCRNVNFRDFSVLNGGHFAILATGVDNFTVDNLKLDTNRDGIDIDCCNNVRVSNCSVNAPWDDGICLKASYALGYVRHCQNVTISNCYVSGFDRGSLLDASFKKGADTINVPDKGGVFGRIKLGTESNGDFKNITITNCVFENSRGIALESEDGSNLEDISITNITMRDANSAPIFMRLGSRMRGPEGTPMGHVRRINISNLVAYNSNANFCSLLSGVPGHDIEDVKLDNIRIWYQGGGTKEQASVVVPENEKAYPDPQMFGVLPAYGFYIRHARNIELSNIEVYYQKEDFRPAFVFDDVKGINLLNVKAQHTAGVPVIDLRNVSNFSTWRCSDVSDMKLKNVAQKKF